MKISKTKIKRYAYNALHAKIWDDNGVSACPLDANIGEIYKKRRCNGLLVLWRIDNRWHNEKTGRHYHYITKWDIKFTTKAELESYISLTKGMEYRDIIDFYEL